MDDTFQQCFRKIRIHTKDKVPKDKGKKDILENMKLKTDLKISLKISTCKMGQTILEQQIEEVDKCIARKTSGTNANRITEQIFQLCGPEGKFSQSGVWKLKNKLWPQSTNPPMAKKDIDDNLFTSPSKLKSLYRTMVADYEDVLILKNELWKHRLQTLRKKVTSQWKMDNLDRALRYLKNNLSWDPLGIA